MRTPRAAIAQRVAVTTTAPTVIEDNNDNELAPYWFDPRIHNWGNTGLRGRFHATFAPLATAIIDRTSYGGRNIRSDLLSALPSDATVLDLCCGVGFSTVKGGTGVDTSQAMLDVARLRRPDCTFEIGNSESYGDPDEYDIVTVMFGTHEMPTHGRRRVLRNAMRVARREVWLVDIDPDFEETLKSKPLQGASFLSGEPYVLDYLRNIDTDVRASSWLSATGRRGWRVHRVRVMEKHVVLWRLERLA